MSKLGTQSKPVIVRAQTKERANELYEYCNSKGWHVIVGIEPDKPENIDDIKKLERGIKKSIPLRSATSRNAPCPCGSGKQYKRCCGI